MLRVYQQFGDQRLDAPKPPASSSRWVHGFATPAMFGLVVLAVFSAASADPLPADFTMHNTGLRGDNFQSHNQKIAYTQNGVFRSGDVQQGGSTWVIVERSTDGGSNWSTIHDTGRDTRPTSVEADPRGNVYVVYPESGNTRFLKFSPTNSYGSPVIDRSYTEATSASKFTSCYDPGQNRVYHATQWGHLLTIDADNGNLLRSQRLIQDGGGSRPSYPHLFVDEFGVVHYAMTVADGGDDVPYSYIRYMKSLDGGQSWKAMDGTSVSTPTSAAGGPATVVSRSGEANYATWLANMHAKDGKVHFTYQTDNPWNPSGAGNPTPIDPFMNYMRFDEATGAREIDRTDLAGDSLSINADAASFASDTANSDGALYVVGERPDGHRLHALVSYDHGDTWEDYAQSNWYSLMANPGVARSATPEGKIVGGVATEKPWWASVTHFELPAAQSSMTIAHWDGRNGSDSLGHDANWVGGTAPTFDNTLAVVLPGDDTPGDMSNLQTGGDRTFRSLIFSTYADTDINLRLQDGSGNGDVLTFDTAVAGGSAEIAVHHDATANINIGGGASTGSVVLADPLLVAHDGSGRLTISRPIHGPHSVTKTGTGTLRLSGDNHYSGATTVDGGTLELHNATGSANHYRGGDIRINNGATLAISKSGNNQYWFNNKHFAFGPSGGGTLDTTDGVNVVVYGGSTVSTTGGAQNTIVGSSGINLHAGDTLNFDVADGTDAVDLDVSAHLWNGGGVNKTGDGVMRLSGNNTYGGATTVNGGTLIFNTPNHNTHRGDGIFVNNGSTVEITQSGGYTRYDFATTWTFDAAGGGTIATGPGLNFVFTGDNEFVTSGGARNVIEGASGINMNNRNIVFDVAAGTDGTSDLDVDVALINSSGGLTKTGDGTLRLTRDNHYRGTTSVDGGTLELHNATGSANHYRGGEIHINNGATLAISKSGNNQYWFNNKHFAFGPSGGGTLDTTDGVNVVVYGGSTVSTTGGAQNTIVGSSGINLHAGDTLNFDVADGTDAVDLDVSAHLWNGGGVNKTGDGVMRLSGNHQYRGTTTIGGGTLLVEGSHSGGGAYTVAAGATLGGSGDIGGSAVDLSGRLSPGSSVGTLATGSQTWNDGGSFLLEIDDAAGTAGASPGWDLLSIDGELVLTGIADGGFTIALDALPAGPLPNFTADGSTAIAWDFVHTTGGLVDFQSSMFTVDTSAFADTTPLTNVFGTGEFEVVSADDKLWLEFTAAVPEPGSSALAALGILGLALGWRRRRRCAKTCS